MTDGTATGLVDAATVVREAEEKRAAAKARMERLGDDASGRFAATAVRDKATGRILTAEEVAAREAGKDAAEKPKERERPIWATGVAQAKQIAEGTRGSRRGVDKPVCAIRHRRSRRRGDAGGGALRGPDGVPREATRAAGRRGHRVAVRG